MSYTPTTWVAGQTLVSADNLNHMEQGIFDAAENNVIKTETAWGNETGTHVYKYEGEDTSTYNIPSAYCFVICHIVAANRGYAIAYDWRKDQYPKRWFNTLHDSWQGWVPDGEIRYEMVTFSGISWSSATIGTRAYQTTVTVGDSDNIPVSAQICYTNNSNVGMPMAFFGYTSSVPSGEQRLVLNVYASTESASDVTVSVMVGYVRAAREV